MKSNRVLIAVVVIALAVMGLAGYFYVQSSNQQAQNNQQAEEQLPEGTSKEPLPDIETRQFAVTAGNYYFTPAEIRVKKGERVRIVLTSEEMSHDFTIDELGVTTGMVAPGTSKEIEFVVEQAGEFTYYCSVSGHRELGQTGKLIVEE